jgi:hypothetical protein
MTAGGQDASSPWRRPSPDALPGPDATLDEIIRFARSADTTEHFSAVWGDRYETEVRALWERCVESYKAGVPVSAQPDELTMCLNYDLALGPYLGVPEPHKLPFLRWLIEGIRES